MSPLRIRMLLHYYTSPLDYRQVEQEPHSSSPAVGEALYWFVEQGLLKPRFSDVDWTCWQAHKDPSVSRPLFTITEKGVVMVEALMVIQVPVRKWVQPEAKALRIF